jgi:hypothetical protein
MKQSWILGLEPDIAKEIKGDFKSSLLVRNRLAVLLNDKITSSRRALVNKEGYEVANWAYKQADGIGYERALQEVISLILEDK